MQKYPEKELGMRNFLQFFEKDSDQVSGLKKDPALSSVPFPVPADICQVSPLEFFLSDTGGLMGRIHDH